MLKLGDRGYQVALMQQYLTNHGFPTMVDGYFDAKTKKALMTLQESIGHEPTGEWDDNLYLIYRARTESVSQNVPSVFARDTNQATTTTANDAGTNTGAEGSGNQSGSNGSSQAGQQASNKNAYPSKAPAQVTPDTYAWADLEGEAFKVAQSKNNGKFPNGEDIKLLNDERKPTSWEAEDGRGDTTDESPMEMVNKASNLMKVKIVPVHDPSGQVIFYGIPEEVTDNNTANFVPIAVKGRSAPFQDYENSGPRRVSFPIFIHGDYCPGKKIRPVINSIRAFTYPRKEVNIKPVVVNFFMGDWKIKCVVDSVGVVWKKPIIKGWYCSAEVTINMTEVVDNTVYYDQVTQRDRWI